MAPSIEKQDEFNNLVLQALEDNPEAVVNRFVSAIESEKGNYDRFVSFVREQAGEVQASKVEDALEQFDTVTDEMSPSEARSMAKMALKGQTPPQTPKQIRDSKWWIGNPQEALKDPNFQVPKRAGSRLVITMSQVWRETGGIFGDFWPQVRDRAKEQGYKTVHDKVDKALEAGTLTAGGATVRERMSDELISFLYSSSVLPEMGARTLDITDGAINFGRQTGSSTAFWVGELEALSGSEQKFGKVKLEPHKLGVLTVISNELLERAPAGFEQLVEDDIEMVARLSMDQAGLIGDGQNAEPLGIYGQTESDNKFSRQNTGSSASIAEIHQDQYKLLNKIDTDKVDRDDGTAGWILHPRTKNALAAQISSDDELTFFASMIGSGNLQGEPFETTTQMPTGLDDSGEGTGDETRMLFGVFSQLIIGQGRELNITQVQAGQVPDADSNTINLITQDATAMVLFAEVDYLCRRKKAFAWLEGVDYAPDLGF